MINETQKKNNKLFFRSETQTKHSVYDILFYVTVRINEL